MDPARLKYLTEHAWHSMGRELYSRDEVRRVVSELYHSLRKQHMRTLGKRFDEHRFDTVFEVSILGPDPPDGPSNS